MLDLDPDRLRLPDLRPLKPGLSSRPPRPKTGARFLRGPIPWNWICAASRQPGRALPVGIALWHWAGLAGRRTVKLSYKEMTDMGVNRHAVRRGLRCLEAAGLVSVKCRPGCAPEVTILDAP